MVEHYRLHYSTQHGRREELFFFDETKVPVHELAFAQAAQGPLHFPTRLITKTYGLSDNKNIWTERLPFWAPHHRVAC